jgi:hypothetical protein
VEWRGEVGEVDDRQGGVPEAGRHRFIGTREFYWALFEPAHLYIMLATLLILNSRYTKSSDIPSIVMALLKPPKTI